MIKLSPAYAMDSPSLTCRVFVDGTVVSRQIFTDIPTRLGHPTSLHKMTINGVEVSVPGLEGSNRYLLKPFKFAKIETCKFVYRIICAVATKMSS